MSMTKKDFQAMADAVAYARRNVTYAFDDNTASQASALAALDAVSEQLATACAGQYKGGYGFNRSRFLEACGVSSD